MIMKKNQKEEIEDGRENRIHETRGIITCPT